MSCPCFANGVTVRHRLQDTWLGNPINPLQYPGTDRGKGWLEADYSEVRGRKKGAHAV